ncbi:MAG: MerR family transcriptional regulator [Sphingomonas sp.]
MFERLFSRQELCRLAHVPDDVFAFWMQQGLLRDRNAGNGRKHRRFDHREVRIAAFLRAARAAGLNIAALTQMVERLRRGLALFDYVAAPADWVSEVDGLNDFGKMHSALAGWIEQGRMTSEVAVEIVAAHTRLHENYDREAYWLGYSIEYPGVSDRWSAYSVGDTWLIEAREPPESGNLPAEAVLVFDMRRIFKIDWPASDGK